MVSKARFAKFSGLSEARVERLRKAGSIDGCTPGELRMLENSLGATRVTDSDEPLGVIRLGLPGQDGSRRVGYSDD